MALSPVAAGGVQVTRACWEAASAETPVGPEGATAVSGVTAFDLADSGPEPFGLAAVTVNVYVVPFVRPVTVVVVSGGEPVIVFAAAVCAGAPTYGVIVYEVTAPPLEGADQDTVAEVLPAAVAVTFETAPGVASGEKMGSTQ